jgi:DNA-binding transcriptional LysR family regulator
LTSASDPNHSCRFSYRGWLTFNTSNQIRGAVMAGTGLGYLPEDSVAEEISKARLRRVLEDWCAPFPGYHLYNPSRRHVSPAFTRAVEALRYKR